MLFGLVIAALLESTTTPYPGVTHEVYVEDSIPARIHVVVIDLSSQEIHPLATEPADRGLTVSEFAAPGGPGGAARAHIAVNGDYFPAVSFQPAGLAMGGGTVWTDSADDDRAGFFRFDRNSDLNGADFSPPGAVVAAADLPVGTLGVVSGRPMIVQAGAALGSFDCGDLVAMPCERAPRTAVALSADARTMWLVVVDGWQEGSVGMTAAELGSFLRERGAADALLLDGGGSSALYIHDEGGLVSAPSDGIDRAVANHMGIVFGALAPGEMLGLLRECSVDNEGAEIEGALVQLDDGQTRTTAADGRYDFANMTPRWACITASKAGYVTKTQCRQVMAGVVTFNSMAMAPESGCPMADAGPRPDAAPRPDAGGPGAPDSGAPDDRDGGTGGGGVTTCGCRVPAGPARDPRWPLALCALALILVRSRSGRS